MSDKKRILIVEDDEDIGMVEEAYLEAAGFDTFIVSDGTKVSALLQKESFDLVLLDLMLPGKSGYEVCREIRDMVDIPILMVTARTESIDKILGLGMGADDYIGKPFDPTELVARVLANIRQHDRLLRKLPEENTQEIRIADLRILVNSWKVYKGDKEIRLPYENFSTQNVTFVKYSLCQYYNKFSPIFNRNFSGILISPRLPFLCPPGPGKVLPRCPPPSFPRFP